MSNYHIKLSDRKRRLKGVDSAERIGAMKRASDRLQAIRPGFDCLPDDVIANALSFLFSGDKTDWKEAAHDLSSISCLNKAISSRLKRSILPTITCSVNLLHFLCPSRTFYTLISLGKSKIKLSALHINGGYNDFDLLATLLSLHFNATKIHSLTLVLPARPVPSRYIAPRADSEFQPPYITDESRMGQSIKIPVEFTKTSLSGFLSLRCFHSLTTLKTSVLLNPSIWDQGSDIIFQLPMLRFLDLKLTFVAKPRTPVSTSIQALSDLIYQMRNLEELTLSVCGCDPEQCAVIFMNSFALRSTTLRIVNFDQLPSGFYLRECQCPRLEMFTCRSSCVGNGVRPGDPAIVGNRDFAEDDEEYSVGSCPFFGMDVPSECIVSFRSVQSEKCV